MTSSLLSEHTEKCDYADSRLGQGHAARDVLHRATVCRPVIQNHRLRIVKEQTSRLPVRCLSKKPENSEADGLLADFMTHKLMIPSQLTV